MTPEQALKEYDKFCLEVAQGWTNQIIQISQRYGQFYFNMLYKVRPDVADKIRATPLDPFYWDEVSLETERAVIEYWRGSGYS